ncbi:MAG: hypothetical protein KTV68_15405 [Acidimicrobiia bacterium]|nr:hypothetical protein [Acidimicrobiia bacterium]
MAVKNRRKEKGDRIGDLRIDVNQRFVENREDMNKRFVENRDDMNRQFADHRDDMNRQFAEHREDMNQRFAEHREDMNRRFDEQRAEVELAARYGQSIEFKLTVTDGDTPAATASTTLIFEVNQRPTADIAVTANTLEEDGDADDIDHYSVDAVIDGPGENGNADNEWDIKESALLVLDGSGSSDANG